MPIKESPKLTRGPGLPPKGSEDHFFGFDQEGNIWGLQWSKQNDAWVGVGFTGRLEMLDTRIFRGEAEAAIASYVSTPISLLDLPEAQVSAQGNA